MKVILLCILVFMISGCASYDSTTVQMLNRRIQLLEAQVKDGPNMEPTPFRGSNPVKVEPTTEPFIFIWVPNDNGSSTPVKLRQLGTDTWMGPKGEYYLDGLPNKEQLKQLYGIDQ